MCVFGRKFAPWTKKWRRVRLWPKRALKSVSGDFSGESKRRDFHLDVCLIIRIWIFVGADFFQWIAILHSIEPRFFEIYSFCVAGAILSLSLRKKYFQISIWISLNTICFLNSIQFKYKMAYWSNYCIKNLMKITYSTTIEHPSTSHNQANFVFDKLTMRQFNYAKHDKMWFKTTLHQSLRCMQRISCIFPK